MSTETTVLHQVMNDPYRSPAEKEAARKRLQEIRSGQVAPAATAAPAADLVSAELGRLARQVQGLTARVEQLEAAAFAAEAFGQPPVAETIVPEQPPVEPTPVETKSDGRGQTQGRPKNRYQVEGERGNWGIKDLETGFFVWPVQKLRKDADAFCRQINAGKLEPQQPEGELAPPSRRMGGHNANTADVAQVTNYDPADPLATASPVETAEGQIGQPAEPVRMYQTHEEKPLPAERPDKEKATNSGTGRVPWYAK